MPRISNKRKNCKKISEQKTKKIKMDEEETDFISFRFIRLMWPLIDLCDFLALIIFEDRHPELYVNSKDISIPSDKTQMILKKSTRLTNEQRKQMLWKSSSCQEQIDAFHRVWMHKKYGPELKELIHDFREERKQARINGDTSNRFINSHSYVECLENQLMLNDLDKLIRHSLELDADKED